MLTKGDGGVSQLLTKADKGGRGVSQKLTFADRGGGVYEPPFLADVICEQPLIVKGLPSLLSYIFSVMRCYRTNVTD